MRIAFVSANREVLPDPVVPLGLAYLMGNTPPQHQQKLIDLCWPTDPLAALKNELDDFQPDAVALGLRNIQNSNYSGTHNNIAYYQNVVATIRQTTRAPLIIGGGGFSVLPHGLMQRL